MDIKPKKPRVIDLRKKKKTGESVSPRNIPITPEVPEVLDSPQALPNPPEIPSSRLPDPSVETFSCVVCGVKEAPKELGRCVGCEDGHQKLCRQLDAKPRQIIEKKPMEWIYKTEVKGGVVVKTFMTKDEARSIGIKVD